jgi:hypothetical protein
MEVILARAINFEHRFPLWLASLDDGRNQGTSLATLDMKKQSFFQTIGAFDSFKGQPKGHPPSKPIPLFKNDLSLG